MERARRTPPGLLGQLGDPSWYAEATSVLDLDAREQPLTDLAGRSEVRVGADGLGSINTATKR